jgi:hypothetical protein
MVLVDVAGIENLTKITGFLVMVVAIGNLIGIPVIGDI